jgi:hypothetical protein
MRRVIGLVSVVALAVFSFSQPLRGGVMFSDDFESGNFNAWTNTTGNWTVVTSPLSALSSSRGADIKGNTEPGDDYLMVEVPSLGCTNLLWQYAYKVRESLDADDVVFAEWSPDGVTWLELTRYSNLPAGDWQQAQLFLPPEADNNPDLAMRFRARLSSTGDRMNFDNIIISGNGNCGVVPEPSSLVFFGLASSLLFLRRR